jgi:hypothetical protein
MLVLERAGGDVLQTRNARITIGTEAVLPEILRHHRLANPFSRAGEYKTNGMSTRISHFALRASALCFSSATIYLLLTNTYIRLNLSVT